jgi:peptidyl-prolyl cis-trans isomerase C
LLHFIVAGFALFILYALMQPERSVADASRRIELSAADVARVELAFVSRWERPPTAAELKGLLASEVRTEILSREAIALGLDKDDIIVKRRLAQKMEFLAEDVSHGSDPGREELRAWFDKNQAEFVAPSRITFRQVFFSTDKRGAGAEAAARRALATTSSRLDAELRGDPFMFEENYVERTAPQVADVFGSDFAKTVFSTPVGRWSGPFASGLGWHLVRTQELRPGVAPAYDDVEADVRERWTSEQRETAKRAAFEATLARYQVILPNRDAVSVAAAPPSAPVK